MRIMRHSSVHDIQEDTSMYAHLQVSASMSCLNFGQNI